MSDISQSGGMGSTNTQIVNHGLSLKDTMAIYDRLIEANLEKLVERAADVADQRIEEFKQQIMEKLSALDNSNLSAFARPDGQIALFEAQKAYATSGEAYHLDVLVKLIAELAVTSARSMDAIAIEEAVKQVPLLLPRHLNALGAIVITRYLFLGRIANLDRLVESFQRHYFERATIERISNLDLMHLEYCRCGAVQIGSIGFVPALMHNYRGIFQNGLPLEEMNNRFGNVIPNGAICPLVGQPLLSLPAESMWQVAAIHESGLVEKARAYAWTDEKTQIAKDLLLGQTKTEDDVMAILNQRDPRFGNLKEVWNSAGLDHFTLTTVGLVIGHISNGLEGAIGDWLR